jgi:hypothetical protein
VLERRGFLRCVGKRCIGFFGERTPVFVGDEDEISYRPMHEFDGLRIRASRIEPGPINYVTAGSGTGKLFAELEEFCETHGILATA